MSTVTVSCIAATMRLLMPFSTASCWQAVQLANMGHVLYASHLQTVYNGCQFAMQHCRGGPDLLT